MIEHPASLSPTDINSFAYITFKDRLPVILAKIVDSLYRNKKIIIDELGSDKIECLKYITAEMSRLRHELTTNKPLTLFDDCIFGDEHLWNEAIVEEKTRLIDCGISYDDITWFKCSFLFGECYMYRRIYDAVLKSGLRELDYFYFEKVELLQQAMQNQLFLSNFLRNIYPELPTSNKKNLFSYFETVLKMSLWGNEVDLSLSIDDEDAKLKMDSPEKIVESNNNKILIDDSLEVFELLYEKSKMKQEEIVVTIFLDNSGSELLADLHLIDFLLESQLVHKVVLYVKPMPWYVSDVTEQDFQHTVRSLCNSSNEVNQWLGQRINSRIFDELNLTIRSHFFMTLSHPFHKMQSIFPELYSEISKSSLLIFKGDLNYRKLVSDLQWPVLDTTFYTSLLGFTPTSIVALRVLKCDVQVGLNKEALSRVEKEHPNNWMICSTYGVIQSYLIKL